MAPKWPYILLAVGIGFVVTLSLIFSVVSLSNMQSPPQSVLQPIPPVIASNSTAAKSFSIALVGDLGCGVSGNKTLAQIQEIKPSLDRLFLLGDYSYRNDWKCFQNQLIGQGVDGLVHGPSNSFKDVVVGNHEYPSGRSDHLDPAGRSDFINYFDLDNQPGSNNYSFDYQGIHFTILDTGGDKGEGLFSTGSEAYKFLAEDLRISAQNATTQWRIVLLHRPVYASLNSGHDSGALIRDGMHPLLDRYSVDLVVNGHIHAYERTYPIKYNEGDSSRPIKTVQGNGSAFDDPDGEIFLTVGAGGYSHSTWIGNEPSWVANSDDNNYGFMKLTFSSDGKSLSGYYLKSSDGSSLDSFSIKKK